MSQIVTFDPHTHTYRMGGAIVPSVTQVLRLAGLGYQMFTDVTESAEFGTAVHKMIDAYNKGESYPVSEAMKPYLDCYKEFLEITEAKVLMSETLVYSVHRKFAGTLDSVMEINGEYCIVDLKSSMNKHKSYPIQTAGYQDGLRECGLEEAMNIIITKRYNLHIDGKRWKLEQHKDKRDARVWNSCLTVAHYNLSQGERIQ